MKGRDYKDQIIELYKSGRPIKEIKEILGFQYLQPIYNVLKKEDCYDPSRTKESYFRIYTVDEDFFKNIDNEAKAYVLGFIAADGYLDIKWGRLTISLAKKDEEILFKIREVMKSNHPIKESIKKNPYKKSNRIDLTMVTISFNSREIVNDLRQLGLDNQKTFSLDAKLIESVPEDLKNHFLRGYFDGDGSLMYGQEYSSGVKYLVQVCGLKDFLENTFGKQFETNCSLYKDKKSSILYVWKIAKKAQVDTFLKKLYENSTIYLERKKEIANKALM